MTHHLLTWHLSGPHLIGAVTTAVVLLVVDVIWWHRPSRLMGETRRETRRISREIAAERDQRRQAAWDRAYGRRR